VHVPEVLFGVIDECLDLIGIAHIGVLEGGLAALRFDLFDHIGAALVVDVTECDCGALVSEEPCRGLPQSGCTTGDDGDLALKPAH